MQNHKQTNGLDRSKVIGQIYDDAIIKNPSININKENDYSESMNEYRKKGPHMLEK